MVLLLCRGRELGGRTLGWDIIHIFEVCHDLVFTRKLWSQNCVTATLKYVYSTTAVPHILRHISILLSILSYVAMSSYESKPAEGLQMAQVG